MKRLFVNGALYSGWKLKADSIAVSRGTIIDIGPKSKLLGLKRHGFTIVDMKKKAVLPGFIDSHVHLLETGYNLLSLDLSGLDSLAEVLARIERYAKRVPIGNWVTGRGWDRNLWGEEFPNKSMLDRVCPDQPALFFSKDGHAAWVNSMALQQTGVGEFTPEPEGGSIRRARDGSPTGILFDNAIDLVRHSIPAPTREFDMKALEKAVAKFVKLGITGVADCDIIADRLGLFLEAAQRGKLKHRVLMMLAPEDVDSAAELSLRTGYGNDYVTIGPVKLYMDGSLGSQTAWMHSPYEGRPDYSGISTLTHDQLEMYFEKTHMHRMSLAVHAIGDRANTELLDFFGRKQAVSRKLGLRHRIEHAQLLRKGDIPKFKKYDVAASMQPIHIIADRDVADRHWGPRSKLAYAFNSLLASGSRLGFGSDSPVEDPNPLAGIYAAVARKKPGDPRPPWYPEQAIEPKQAVECYTRGSASICWWEGKAGELAAGAWADFVILSDDIFKIALEKIPQAKVLATIVGGEIVYIDSSFRL